MDELNNFQLEISTVTETVIGLVLALMMFAVALGLRINDFSFIKRAPRIYIAGVVGQLVLLPLLTLGLCLVLTPPPSVAMGLILVSCCPGGNVSNILVLLARGNTALSVSLTATSSVAAAFITPVSIVFWSAQYAPTADLMSQLEFGAQSFLLQTLTILGLPLLLGMLCAHYLPALSDRMKQPLVALSTLGLLVIIVFAYFKYSDVFIVLGLGLIALVALHNGLAFLLGFTMACCVRAGSAERRALSYEVGIQNSGLGMVIILTQLSGLGGAAAVAGLWGVWHIFAGLLLVILLRSVDHLFAGK